MKKIHAIIILLISACSLQAKESTCWEGAEAVLMYGDPKNKVTYVKLPIKLKNEDKNDVAIKVEPSNYHENSQVWKVFREKYKWEIHEYNMNQSGEDDDKKWGYWTNDSLFLNHSAFKYEQSNEDLYIEVKRAKKDLEIETIKNGTYKFKATPENAENIEGIWDMGKQWYIFFNKKQIKTKNFDLPSRFKKRESSGYLWIFDKNQKANPFYICNYYITDNTFYLIMPEIIIKVPLELSHDKDTAYIKLHLKEK